MREAARLLQLEPYLDRKPLNLSGGQQQRTAIARALVKRADLVLLDEPLANLDYKLREELREELPRVFAASGAIFVYATTEPSEALLLGGDTATLFQGRVTQFGPTAQVYRRPHDLVTARVFSDPPLNTLTARKTRRHGGPEHGRAGRATGGCLRRRTGRALHLGFRAHHLGLEPAGADAIPIAATVSVVRDHGVRELHPPRCGRAPLRGAGSRGPAARAGLARDGLSRSAPALPLRRSPAASSRPISHCAA